MTINYGGLNIVNDNKTTEHGENIANQVQTEDAYGCMNDLAVGDLYVIIDNLNTHFIDNERDDLIEITVQWLHELDTKFPELDVY